MIKSSHTLYTNDTNEEVAIFQILDVFHSVILQSTMGEKLFETPASPCPLSPYDLNCENPSQFSISGIFPVIMVPSLV